MRAESSDKLWRLLWSRGAQGLGRLLHRVPQHPRGRGPLQVGQGVLQSSHGLRLVALEPGQAELLYGPGEAVNAGGDPSFPFQSSGSWLVLGISEDAALLHRHEGGVVQVPGVGGQASGDRVNDGVLHDVDGARHPGGKEALGPARQPIGLHQEASGEKPVVRRHLPVHDILRENMCAEGVGIPLPESRDNLFPGAADVSLTAEVLDHSLADEHG